MDLQTTTQSVRESSLGWMLKRLAAGLDAEMDKRLAPLGLDLSSFAILMTVLERSPLSQADIAGHLKAAPYRISRGLDHLEKQGYVARHPDARSRRALVIRPTAAGEALAPSLYAVVREVNLGLADPLTEEERAILIKLLSRLVHARAHGAEVQCVENP